MFLISSTDSLKRFADQMVSKIVFAYAAFTALWIVVSDQLVILFFSEPKNIALASTVKGWLFAALTSVLLALLVRRYLNRLVELNAQLQISQERWKFAIEGAGDGVWDWDLQTDEAHYSKHWKEMLGYADNDVLPTNDEWKTRIHPDDRSYVAASMQAYLDGKSEIYVVEYRLRCKDESYKWILGRGMVVKRDESGKPLRMIGTHADITSRKQMEQQVHQLAFYDDLTKLPNRRLLDDRLWKAMIASKRRGVFGAVMFLDLDNFKPINDEYGHMVGDLLLIEAANRLRHCVREVDTVARFGGDEFVAIFDELSADRAESEAQVGVVAGKIRTALAEPYLLTVKADGQADMLIEHHCTVSIGVALFSSQEGSPNDVLKWADAAMYQAKGAGRNAIRLYDASAV
jgi:diguanylate cyclase (GGDEF)-like protein/PAS domain S-box-containing protein